ncbi:hypothetical protein LTR66_000287 [Elasticomyces elasticus]|nr:hypothetical protein LTR66_000287 [Elasticomyces elasticus]
MHYIRFLKTPKIHVDDNSTILKAVVTITTDLGETFYPHEVLLAATLRSLDHDGDVYMRKTVTWTAGLRSLPITFDLSHTDVDWPARLHVGVRDGLRADHLENHYTPGNLPALISVWSDALDPTKGVYESQRKVERRFTPFGERPLTIGEDTGESIARHLWCVCSRHLFADARAPNADANTPLRDGSLALTAHIDHLVALQGPDSIPLLEHVLASAAYRKLNVLELGCGCGVVGISLAQIIPDCNVVLTDLPEVTEIVQRNIACMKPALSSEVSFMPLDWDAPLPSAVSGRIFNLIVVAECIYNTDSIPPLVRTIAALLAKSPRAVVVVATKVRHSSEAMFYDLMAKHGIVEDGRMALPLPGEPGCGYADSAEHVDLYCFRDKGPVLGREGSDESLK